MKRDNERPTSAIWLLADSPPSGHELKLPEPLDWRFPTRHNIWTPIETVINRELYIHEKARIDDSRFYVRNAVESCEHWNDIQRLNEELLKFRKLTEMHRPFLILAFGQRAFEFARRAQGEDPKPSLRWSVKQLSEEFDTRVSTVRKGETNLLPLLHAVVAQKYQYCAENFSGDGMNYFQNVGSKLARVLNEHRADERLSELWM